MNKINLDINHPSITASIIQILFNGFNMLGRINPNNTNKTPVPPKITVDDFPVKYSTMPTSNRTDPTVNPNLRKVVLSSFIFFISSLNIIVNRVQILFSSLCLFQTTAVPFYQTSNYLSQDNPYRCA